MGWPAFTCCPGTTRIRLTGPPTCVMTGVVAKALYATAPVSRSVRVKVVGWTVTTCTCDIWSCGIVKSCGVVAFEAFDEKDVISFACLRSLELQPIKENTEASA